MGGLVSYFWGATGPKAIEDYMAEMDTPDKTTGLTARERMEVTNTWALVKKDVKANGVELFMRFLKKHPEHQARFTAFASVPLDKLRDNKKLLAHAMSVMYAITAVVDNLNDTSCLVEMLTLLGNNHQRRKIPEQGFRDLKVVLLKMLEDTLGPAMTPSALAAFDKTLNVAYSVIFKGMAQAAAAPADAGATTSTTPPPPARK